MIFNSLNEWYYNTGLFIRELMELQFSRELKVLSIKL